MCIRDRLRRLLLLIPTLFGITLLVFAITRVVPGGPLERALQDGATPELRLRLARWYVEAGEWRAVTGVLAPLNNRGNDHTTSQARLLLGMAHFELGETDAAREAFGRALQFPQTSQSAQQWLDFIDSLSTDTA